MCNVLDDYLKTYSPDVTEFHSDSSDFEGTASSLFTQKMGRRKHPMRTLYPIRKKDSMFQSCNSQMNSVTENSSEETWGSVTTTISPNGSSIGIQLQKTFKNKKYKILHSGDQIETIQSKRSVIRHKVIPCISNIFGRSNNNVKQMSIIKENPTENFNIDNGCQTNHVDGEHKTRKFNRRQQHTQYYAAQPVYAVERINYAKLPPFQHTKIVRGPLTTCKAVGNGNFDNTCSLTSSSEEIETHRYLKRKKGKRNKPKCNIVESDLGKEYFDRYEGNALKHIEQQYYANMNQIPPDKNNTAPDQTQKRQKTNGSEPMSLSDREIELGIACSGFWDYLVNTINQKMQTQTNKAETTTNTLPFKPCTCTEDQAYKYCCCPNCENSLKKLIKPDHSSEKKKIGVKCQCPALEKTRPCQYNHDEVAKSLARDYKGQILCIHNPPCILINGCLNLPSAPIKREPIQALDLCSVTIDSKEKKFDYKDAQTPQPQKQPEPTRHPSDEKHNSQNIDAPEKSPYSNVDACSQCATMAMEIKSPFNITKNESCQYQVPQILKQLMHPNYSINYHSPPLEARKQQTTDDKSHTDMRKHQATDVEGYKYRLSSNEIRRQKIASHVSCQYRTLPTEHKKQTLTSDDSYGRLRKVIGMKQIKTKRPKQEKIVQSICPHNPPCQVVRTCCKTKIDPKLQNSCVHVPMCENVPLCLMELKNQYQNISSRECSHKPKCPEIPVCTRNYIMLTAKEEVATQVRPKTKMMCRHEPPCIMIPTCLSRVCDSYVPYDAIPDCIHQPMCEMIPACCRKSAKEMVSFRSQYPSQCRIV